jgi:hypothetical protein
MGIVFLTEISADEMRKTGGRIRPLSAQPRAADDARGAARTV